MTKSLQSADGTPLAYDELGDGPPVITVVGAFNVRSTTSPLAAELQANFKVLNYDRRGRGESGDTQPYSVDREIEDLDALVKQAGGSAFVFGYSSGAVLALRAAASGVEIDKLALYEPPFVVDDSYPRPGADLVERLTQLIDAGRRGDAVELFQTEVVGIPKEAVIQMRQAPFRPGMEQMAHTLVYDAMIIGDLTLPTQMLESIDTSTLLLDGADSPEILRCGARAAAAALPNGRHCSLVGQTHDINPAATAPVLERFLAGDE
jgi:pimeloyl-ACP methyl ester carboxylesterase